MTTLKLYRRLLNRIALLGSALYLSLLFSAHALAGYSPPKRIPPKIGGGGGARTDCPEMEDKICDPVVVLAPLSHIGQTSTTHPTFVWWVLNPKLLPVEFILLEYDREKGRGNPIQRITLPGKAGIMQLTLPQDQPGLTVGKTYVWQVTLLDKPNSPSKNYWMETVVEVVQLPADLQQALSKTGDPVVRANLYATAGLWYEALAETFKTPKGKSFRQTLLTDLAQLEFPDQKARLKAVVASGQ